MLRPYCHVSAGRFRTGSSPGCCLALLGRLNGRREGKAAALIDTRAKGQMVRYYSNVRVFWRGVT